MSEHKDLDEMVARIASPCQDRFAMPRGVVVQDENVSGWAEELSTRHFRVLQPPAGMSDANIKKSMLPGRILVTGNSKEFILDATAFGYSVVAVDKIQTMQAEGAAHILSRAFVEFKLWSKPPSWVLVISPDGKHTFKYLRG